MSENPFRVGGHVTGMYFADRAQEVRRVHRALVEPSHLLVYGPRRMGKSSTIAMAGVRAERDGCLVAWADFSTATTLADVSTRLLRSLSGAMRSLPERIMDLLRNVRPRVNLRIDERTGAPSLTFDAEVRQRPVSDQRAGFESVLDQIEVFAAEHNRRVALVFDEFQDIITIGGDRADWFLRGIMQRHTHISYVCAGSKESLIHDMLGKKSAFYKHFELLPLDPVDGRVMVRWIESRMRSAGVEPAGCGALILDYAGKRTQDRLQLAREIFANALTRGRVAASEADTALDAIVRAESAVYRAIWDRLSAGQQNALRAVTTSPERLYTMEVLSRFGLRSTSSMARAIEALLAQGLLVRTQERVEFDSPFFRTWVERDLLPDIPGI